MTNFRGHLRPPTYVHTEFVEEDDIANINSIMAFDTVNRCDKDAVIAAFEAQTRILLLLKKRLILVIVRLKLRLLLCSLSLLTGIMSMKACQ